jgi:hypothetical protein
MSASENDPKIQKEQRPGMKMKKFTNFVQKKTIPLF